MENVAPLSITIRPPKAEVALKPASDAGDFFGEDGFSFKDILDIINPFQQLPVVSTLYREESGDTLSIASRLAGGALFGGPLGFVLALANTIVEEATGSDVGENVLAALSGDGGDAPSPEKYSEPAPTHGAAARGHYSAYVRSQSLFS